MNRLRLPTPDEGRFHDYRSSVVLNCHRAGRPATLAGSLIKTKRRSAIPSRQHQLHAWHTSEINQSVYAARSSKRKGAFLLDWRLNPVRPGAPRRSNVAGCRFEFAPPARIDSYDTYLLERFKNELPPSVLFSKKNNPKVTTIEKTSPHPYCEFNRPIPRLDFATARSFWGVRKWAI